MAKRSDFKRRPADAYQTIDPRASRALKPYLYGVRTFIEPCAGEGHLVRQLEDIGLLCVHSADIADGHDAMQLVNAHHADAIITNPPWTRVLLHSMILRFQAIAPTWLLFDGDWAFNKHAAPYLDQCSDIVAVGRLRWVEGTTVSGKDNSAWYKFWHRHSGGPKFHGRK
jgi:hypothetical protein